MVGATVRPASSADAGRVQPSQRAATRRAFYPDTESWRELVLARTGAGFTGTLIREGREQPIRLARA